MADAPGDGPILREESKRLVLLGAGVSVPVGLPTATQLHERLYSEPDLGIYRSISDFLAVVEPDVERVFALLDFATTSGQVGSLAHDLDVVMRAFGKTDKTVNALADYLFGNEKRAIDEVKQIQRILREIFLFPMPRLAPIPDEPFLYLRRLSEVQRGGTIVTLNYDNALEYSSAQMYMRTMDRITVPPETDQSVRILKLHGSIDWERVGDDVIDRTQFWTPSETDYDPAIIFGAGNKLRYYGPFLDLMRAFRDTLFECGEVLTIGYSFRDPHVNDALRVWARTAPKPGRGSPMFASAKKSLGVCIGPVESALPAIAGQWKAEYVEHLAVEAIRGDARDVVTRIFGESEAKAALDAQAAAMAAADAGPVAPDDGTG